MTQSMPLRSRSWSGPSSGSSERNFRCAAVDRRLSMRSRYLSHSTLTPIQTLEAQSSFALSSARRSARFVSTWKRCQYARDITPKTRRMYVNGTSLWKRSLIEFTKIVCGFFHLRGSSNM
jgi:hypothetical protein